MTTFCLVVGVWFLLLAAMAYGVHRWETYVHERERAELYDWDHDDIELEESA